MYQVTKCYKEASDLQRLFDDVMNNRSILDLEPDSLGSGQGPVAGLVNTTVNIGNVLIS
jgi:hypothetical protein